MKTDSVEICSAFQHLTLEGEGPAFSCPLQSYTDDLPSSNSGFSISTHNFKKLIRTCLDKPATSFSDITSDSVPLGKTGHQTWLMGILFHAAHPKAGKQRAAILPQNWEIMKPLADIVSAACAAQTETVVKLYASRPEAFALLFYNTVKILLSPIELTTTGDSVTDVVNEISNRIKLEDLKNDKDTERAFLIGIKQLVYIANEYCIEQMTKLFKESKTCKGLLSGFTTLWQNYYLSAREIGEHLRGIDKCKKEQYPKFSVTKLLCSVFSFRAYVLFRKELHYAFSTFVGYIAQSYVSLAAGSKSLESKELEADEYIAKRAFQAFVDQVVDEVTVHYLGSTKLKVRYISELVEGLSSRLSELCDKIKADNVLQKLESLYKTVTVACLWGKIDESTLNSRIKAMGDNIKSICLEALSDPKHRDEIYKKAKEEQQKRKEQIAKMCGFMSTKQEKKFSEIELTMIKRLFRQSKAETKGTAKFPKTPKDAELCTEYMLIAHEDLCLQYIGKCRLVSDSEADKYPADTEIAIMNRQLLGIDLTDKLLLRFNIWGISNEELLKLKTDVAGGSK